MNRKGTRSGDGKTYDAYTGWFVRWQFRYVPKGGRCAVQSVSTSVAVTYTMPKWADEARGPSDLRDRWRRYLRNLQEHEDGHRDIGVAAASEIEQAIGRLGPQATCRDLEAKANALGHSILDKYRSKERFYDLRTLHGRTQGAVFP